VRTHQECLGRGVNEPIDDFNFHFTHGTLFYAVFHVLPTFATYKSHHLDAETLKGLNYRLQRRVQTLVDTKAIGFRPQNGCDSAISSLTLRNGLRSAGQTGLSSHIKNENKYTPIEMVRMAHNKQDFK
jgi:NAD(P)H dehydrogenase (quinone)